MTRLGKRRRHAGPAPLGLVRGARHWASPAGRPWRAAPPARREVPGWTSPAVCQAWAREGGAQAPGAAACRGPPGTRFPSTRSQAGTGARSRRVVSQGEVADPGVPPRVVGTALEPARPQGRYQTISGARGPAENASQAPQRSVQAERTACQRLAAPQWRVVLPAAAAVALAT